MTCTICAAATDLYACQKCVADIRSTLTGLIRGPLLDSGHYGAGWLEALEDAAHGRTRLGSSARRSSEKGSPMLCNLRASDLLGMVTDMLQTWVRDLCESRGVQVPRLTLVGLASWLLEHIDALALHPAVDEFADELKQRVGEIERMINRPELPRYLGPCPTLLDREQVKRIKHRDIDGKRQMCSTQLTADRKATKVTCPVCETTHDADELVRLMRNHLEYEPMTSVELLGSRTSDLPGVLEQLGEPVARSTFHYWRKERRLAPRCFRTRAGVIIPARQDKGDVELFWLADIHRLLAANGCDTKTA